MSPFRRKKSKDKSKNLPPPPSMFKQEDSSSQAPPRSQPPIRPLTLQDDPSLRGPPRVQPPIQPTSRQEEPSLREPPRTQPPIQPTASQDQSPLRGPPRLRTPHQDFQRQEKSSIPTPPALSPPPISPQKTQTRLPLPEPPTPSAQSSEDSAFVQDNLSTDILDELRQTKFGTDLLQDTPTQKGPKKATKEMVKSRYIAAKEAYQAAGKKHLEMNFHENAAADFALATLSLFLGTDAYQASNLISELAVGAPSAVISHHLFQGVRLLLKANLVKNTAFLIQAERWLLKDIDSLYAEDKELIERALRITRTNLE